MRHNKWNKYLKIACSWILIFSMCFLSLNTVNASAEDTNAFESESETGDTEAFTSDTEISDTEIESEPSTDQFTSESEETKQETEKQIPDSIEVEQLNAEIQNRVANGEVPSTDRVEYVDEKGKIIEGAPTAIKLGTIADHKDLAITGKNYEFKSARVNGKDCVYIGKYNDTVYYSTDGVIAIKLDDGQKLTMTYQEYYNIKVNEEIPEGGVAGTITTKAGTVKVNTAETIRVNAGETWKFTVKPGTANKVRYKIGSVKGADTSSTSITRVSGDEYEAYYEANFQKDDTVTIAYDKEGVYRVTINRTASDGTEYLNEDHSKDALDFTFTEKELDADGAITIPDIHTKRGYRLINMAINGTTLAETTGNNREIPTEEGTGHGITMDANCGDTSYLVTVVMKERFTTHLGNEKDCSYAYSITIKPRRGNWQDINLNLVPYATGQQVLTVKLYTGSGHRSGDGLDVAMWNPDTKKLDPIHDSDTVNMDSVGNWSETLHKRQVRIFFAKSKNGYSSPVGAYKVFGNEESTGGRVIAEKGKVYQLSANTMGETGTLAIYDQIWQEAKNAAQAAGYTEYVAFSGEKTLNTDWEMYVVSFTTTKIDYYVHYKSGLEDDLAVSNIPDNQELCYNRPMHSYGDNPSTTAYEGRSIGVSFTVGEGNEVPTCSGYEFLGWKLQKKDGTLSSETYQNKDVFTVSEDNVEYADNTNLPFGSNNNRDGYQFVAQWKKISTRSVVVNHYLKVPDGTEVLKKTTQGTISFAENNETVTALATPEPAGTFSGYVFDKSDTRNNLEKAVTNDKSTDTIELNLYYKPTVLTVSKTVTGYNMEPNRSYEFTIKVVHPSGTEASTATITDGQIFIKKGTEVKKLTFTNNQATFTLAKDESVDISCLPTGWTYTVTETDPGNNYKTSYKLNGSAATDGTAAKIITSTTGNDKVTFTNASTVAPPETGRTFHDSEWILLLIVVLIISAGGMTFLRKMKKRY
ncbi:DUF5979 domain-containing protein [uncultured Eubacterium sp.]|uniref:DUF7601 domain-containing protein n=1 Tax=uncultured Eubacterium sp. TaxID=165185 RepID=UPI0025E64794|nr:DUF5979 domain-containing protein [uncultured Eubacterium sp.]